MIAQFPREAVGPADILHRLTQISDAVKGEFGAKLRGKPDMPPLAVAHDAIALLNTLNPNNSGIHTLERTPSPDAPVCPWQPTRDLERDVVLEMANLFGFAQDAVDGQITSGSSEGNIAALWMARNAMTSGERMRILGSRTVHYSVLKAADLLGLGAGSIELVSLDDAYAMDVAALRAAMQRCVDAGGRSCAVVATAGGTVTGAIDPIDDICEAVRWGRRRLGLDIHLHIDAAIGGLILPFLTETELPAGLDAKRWGSREEIGSLTLDFHKLGGVPYGAGMLITRKGLVHRVKRDVAMISSGYDATLLGSRSGAIAAAIWAVVQTQGFEGFRRQALHCTELRRHLRAALSQIPGLRLLAEHPLNLAAFAIEGPEPAALGRVARAHHIYRDDIARGETMAPVGIYPCFLMPHNTVSQVDMFAAEVGEALK